MTGLSACNMKEAEAVAALTKWFLQCGVPPAAISIITPYKGQKTAITNALRTMKCLAPFRRDHPPERGTTLTVSTVDRYQGDENDIVILSLVRVNPGNMFVGLPNRFVVATSRARLGFIVVGSVEAVTLSRNQTEGPPHWRRFISSLQLVSRRGAAGLKVPDDDDVKSDDDEEGGKDGDENDLRDCEGDGDLEEEEEEEEEGEEAESEEESKEDKEDTISEE